MDQRCGVVEWQIHRRGDRRRLAGKWKWPGSLVTTATEDAPPLEVKGDSVDVVAEISAELERERQKNKELMERLSMLKAQIRERNMETQENHEHAVARSIKKFKRQKVEKVADEEENKNTIKSEMASQCKPDTEGIVPKEINPAKHLINWMSLDDGQTLYQGKIKDSVEAIHS